ncbi:MAG: preprotein translocase subunit SecG [Bryobacterales bacterium]
MVILLTIIHVLVCLFLIIVVLLQSGGKGADLAGAFGGMGSQTAFGPRGAATVLSKATTVSAVLFMLTSISLGIMQGNRAGTGDSVIERTGQAGQATPAQTGTPSVGNQPIDLPAPGESKQLNVSPEVTPVPEGGSAPATPPAEQPQQ